MKIEIYEPQFSNYEMRITDLTESKLNPISSLKIRKGRARVANGGSNPPKNQYSSESQRQQSPENKNGSRKKSKRSKIKIDREVVLDVDSNILPQDAQFKGYQEVIVQDIKIQTDNIRFKKAKYYSPNTGKS